MSVHNAEEYLHDSINSILNQTFTNFEFLIMNDFSDDGSQKIIEKYSLLDKRIRSFNNNINRGLTASLNELIKKSNSMLIARMDADDISHINRLDIQYKFMLKNQNIGVLGCGANLIDKKGKYICNKYSPKNIKKVIKAMPYHNFITHPSVMMRSSIIQQFGPYNENYKTAQDWELWIKYINSGVKFEILQDNLLSLRIVPTSLSSWQSRSKKNQNYNYALLCIQNKEKSKSFKYFFKLSIYEKLVYVIRLSIPHKIFLLIVQIYQLFYPKSAVNILKKQ